MLLFTNDFLFVTKSWTNKQLNKQQTKKCKHTKTNKNAQNQAWIQGFLWFWFTKTFLSSLPHFLISLQTFRKSSWHCLFLPKVYPFFISTKYLLINQNFFKFPPIFCFLQSSSNFLQLSLYSSQPLHIFSNCLSTPLFLLNPHPPPIVFLSLQFSVYPFNYL